jgi:erythromycin esterase
MKSLSALFALSIMLLAAARPAAAKPPGHDQLVEPGIWRLDGMDPDLPQDDLEPLRKLLHKAQVVGLGETVHTSGGYYVMKHRLFRFLVEEMGYRAFAIESPWQAAERTAQYVATCQGTPVDAARGLFSIWQSQETADFFEWMCTWNQAHPHDTISFFGFDIQQPWDDGPRLIDDLQRLGMAADDPLLAGLRQCDSVETSVWPDPVPDSTHQPCVQALDGVDQFLQGLDPSEEVQPSRAEVEWAKIRSISLRAWEDEAYFEMRDEILSYTARDRGMATVFQRIRKLQAGSAKTAIWAHNTHIAKRSTETLAETTMGTFLDQELGKRYANIALGSAAPSINWRGVGCGSYFVLADSIEKRLELLGEDFLFVDLAFKGAHDPYIEDTEMWLGFRWTAPRRQFDAMVYLAESPMMTPLRWPATCP